MNRVKRSLWVGAVLITAGCSNTAHISKTVIEGAELFRVVATPTMATSNTGVTCVGARGEVWVKERVVSGVLTDDRNRNFRLRGDLGREGSIEAGIAVNGQLLASWQGQISHGHGHGSWRDESGCRGEWSLSEI